MTNTVRWTTGVAAVCGTLAASLAQAQTFDVNLGNKKLGSLTYGRAAKGETLRSNLNNTPLGVFNGTFKASSRPIQSSSGTKAQKYQSLSKSSRKTRKITLLIAAGRAVETGIDPATERTDLSDINRVPRDVIDPVGAIGRLILAQGCPKEFTIYDGRRAIRLKPNGSKKEADLLTCAIQYKVVAGPGHLSPLYISSVKMQVQYDFSSDRQELTQMKLGAGLFSLVLSRKD